MLTVPDLVRYAADATGVPTLLSRCRPELVAATRIIGRTVGAPGLPYVTRIPADPELVQRLRAGLEHAFADPGLCAVRDALLIAGLDVLPAASYRCMAEMEADATRRRYFELD